MVPNPMTPIDLPAWLPDVGDLLVQRGDTFKVAEVSTSWQLNELEVTVRAYRIATPPTLGKDV